MASHIEPAKAELKSADTKESDQTRTTPTGGVEQPTAAATESVKEKAGNPPPAGGANKASEGGTGDNKSNDEDKDQSESLVRGSYLPVNKLKDAPDASKYEGKDPQDYTKTKGPGLGEQLAQKAHETKEKITNIGGHNKEKK